MARLLCVPVAVFLLVLSLAQPGSGAELPALSLSMGEAISQALQANFHIEVAATRISESQGAYDRRLASLLPRVRLETPLAYQTRNLKAQGISMPNLPSVVGPFTSYDFRGYAEQALLDLQSWHNLRASEKTQTVRRNEYEDVRSAAIRQVAAQYLSAQYAQAQVETAASRVRTAEVLEKLARDRREAGTADGLDLLRAQVQLANDRQNLLVTQNAVQQSLLLLARLLGMDLGTPIILTDKLNFQACDAPRIEQAVTAALKSRADYRALLAQREVLEEQLKANRSRYLPKLVLSGNYGDSGQELGDMEPSGAIQANLIFNVFDMDRHGERQEIDSLLKRVDNQIEDQRRGIEQDIREALLNLESAAQQVEVAQGGVGLAERELTFARDRFRHGVTNNIEVITAQDALARAQDNRLHALARHADAKIALARALGATENVYRLFLGI
ncbi:MAG: TolC family protein [Desulfurivibrionaceae bacterium]